MRKITLITYLLLTTYANLNAQTTKETLSTVKISISQKTGDNSYDEEYTLTTKYDENILEFKTRADGTFSKFTTKKITKKYVVGEASGNYAFYNIEKEQFYYIDYFMSRYLVNGYGKDYSSLKESSLQIMKMLKEGKTQKDAIAHLIEQSSYDF